MIALDKLQEIRKLARMLLKNIQIVAGVIALRAIPTLKRAPKGAYAMAKTLRTLTEAVEPYDEVRRTTFKEVFGDEQKVDETHPKWNAWAKSIRGLDETLSEVAVHQCSREDLNLADKTNPDGNDIDHESLSSIWFLFTDW